jgi:hypothetical protein
MISSTNSDVAANGRVSVTHNTTANAMMPRQVLPAGVSGIRLPARWSGAGVGSR